jgi:predicted transcriptional regulator
MPKPRPTKSFKLHEELHTELKEYADSNGYKLQYIINRALRIGLDSLKDGNPTVR